MISAHPPVPVSSVQRAVVEADAIGQRSSLSGDFFRAASNAATTGAIPSTLREDGLPKWVDGVCWVPVSCAVPECEFVDCCADDPECVPFDAVPVTRKATAKAFEVSLLEAAQLCSTPAGAAGLRQKLALAFGGSLWEQVYEAATPVMDGSCVDPAVGVGAAVQDSGFCGQGTWLVPALAVPAFIKDGVFTVSGGQLTDVFGNSVVVSGVPVTTDGDCVEAVLTGPVDYIRSDIVEDAEEGRDRGNQSRVGARMFGLVRSDTCAARRVCVAVPSGCLVVKA